MKKNTAFLYSVLISLSIFSCKNNATPSPASAPAKVKDILCTTVPNSSLSLVKGSEHQLRPKVIPNDAKNKSLSYESENEKVISVTNDGLIKANGTGSANVTVRTSSGAARIINVIVTEKPVAVEDIEIAPLSSDTLSMTIGQEFTFTARALPKEATDKRLIFTITGGISYSLQDEQTCTVRAESIGNATITVTSVNNPIPKKEIHFIVKEKPTIKITEDAITCESGTLQPAFKVQTLNGKLNYTPEVVGSGSRWVRFKTKDSSATEEDLITLECKENKTPWERRASIKFKDGNGNYIKTASSSGRGKDLEVKLTQKKNEHPNVHIEWVYGIDSPSDNEKERIEIPSMPNKWDDSKGYWRDDYIFFWNESENTKWFNTRKIVNLNARLHLGIPVLNGSDTNQCWAKTASNMLHWWFVQNKDYIGRYMEKKGLSEEQRKEYQPYYKRGLSDREEDEKSSIANVFRTKTHDGKQGDFANSALMWYLFGNHSLRQKNYEPALFKDVFNKENSPVEVIPIHTKREFEETIKDALRSKKAIGINIYGTTGYRHYITIWGAAFDNDENIVAVYVVDNNNWQNRIFPYGIHYNGKDIYADENTDGTYPFLFNFPNNAVNKEKYIGEITTLGTGAEQFEAYLNNRP